MARLRDAQQRAEAAKLETQSAAQPQQREEAAQRYTQALGDIETVAAPPQGEKPDPELTRDVAKTLTDLDEPSRAIPHADRAVALAPRDPGARVVRGNANYKLGRYSDAAQDAKHALSLEPGNPAAKALLNLSQARLDGITAKVRVPPDSALDKPRGESQAGAFIRPSDGRSADDAAASSESPSAFERSGNERPPAALYDPAAIAAATAALATAENRLASGDPAGAIAAAGQVLSARADPKAYLVRSKALSALGDARAAYEDADRAVGRGGGAPAYVRRGQTREALRQMPDLILADFKRAKELSADFSDEYDAALARYAAQASAGALPGTDASAPGGVPASRLALLALFGALVLGGAWLARSKAAA